MKEIREAAAASTSRVGSTGQVYRSRSQGDMKRLGSQSLDGTVLPTSMRPMEGMSMSMGANDLGGDAKKLVMSRSSGRQVSVRDKGPQNLSTLSGGLTYQPEPKTTYGREDTVSPEQVRLKVDSFATRQRASACIHHGSRATNCLPACLPACLQYLSTNLLV